jgi:hypothetical protein
MMKGRKIKREENKMMERIYVLMLSTVVFAVVMLFAATGAWAFSQPDGDCTAGEQTEGACGTSDGWLVEIVPGKHVAGDPNSDPKSQDGKFPVRYKAGDSGNPCVDKRGNSIECDRFMYLISAPTGASLSQANIKIPSTCDITLSPWQDSSVKIREYEPSTGFGFDDPPNNVATWDALKTDPSNQAIIAIYLSPSTGRRITTMELKTEPPLQYVTILGPDCCAKIQTATQVEFGTECITTDVSVEYDECSGDALGVFDKSVEPPFEYPTIDGAYVCAGDEFGYDNKSCSEVKKLGPEDGAVIGVADTFLYFGYGNDIYRGPSFDSSSCTLGALCAAGEGGVESAPSVKKIVLDETLIFKYDDCGNLAQVTELDGTPYVQTILWFCEANERGQLDKNACGRVFFGQDSGAVIFANPRGATGGDGSVWTEKCKKWDPLCN